MERRSSLRKPIHHDAMLKLDNGTTWPCIIADYCAEGMLLKYTAEVCDAIAVYMKAVEGRAFKVAFCGEKNEQYELESVPTYIMERASGVRFLGCHDDAIASLSKLNNEGQGRPIKIPEGEIKQIIKECIDCIQAYILPLMKDFYPVVIKDVQAAAVAASSDQLSNAIMEAANKIMREQGSMLSVFVAAIHDLKTTENKGTATKTDALDDLSLIDKSDFEDWLTSRVLITKAETNYRSLLLPLKIRLDAIGIGDKRYHQSPLGPSLLVGAFQTSLSRLTMGSAVERIVFRGFEQQVVVHLEPLYTRLNEIMIHHNVLPHLDVSKIIPKQAKRPQHKTPIPKDQEVTDEPVVVKREVKQSNAQGEETHQGPIFSYGAEPSLNQGSMPEHFQSAESQSIVSALPPFSDAQTSEKDFKQIEDKGVYQYMEWHPQPSNIQ